jgi:hypothetical protein
MLIGAVILLGLTAVLWYIGVHLVREANECVKRRDWSAILLGPIGFGCFMVSVYPLIGAVALFYLYTRP